MSQEQFGSGTASFASEPENRFERISDGTAMGFAGSGAPPGGMAGMGLTGGSGRGDILMTSRGDPSGNATGAASGGEVAARGGGGTGERPMGQVHGDEIRSGLHEMMQRAAGAILGRSHRGPDPSPQQRHGSGGEGGAGAKAGELVGGGGADRAGDWGGSGRGGDTY